MKEPTILYTAVKAIIKNDEGKVLVLKQSDSTITGVNQYHPPGGIIELGAILAQCVVREVKEEIGVDCEVIGLIEVGEWRAERNNEVMQFVGHFYECRLRGNDYKLQDEEASEMYWVGHNEIDSIDILEPSKSIIRRFLQQS